jgi:hypothetical protein
MEPLKDATTFFEDCRHERERPELNRLPQGQYLGFYVPGLSLVLKRTDPTDQLTPPDEGVMACPVSLLFNQ